MAEGLLGLIDGLTSGGPALLALDDVQWADPATVAVLHRVVRTIRQHRLILLLSARAGVDSPARSLLATPPGPGAVRDGLARVHGSDDPMAHRHPIEAEEAVERGRRGAERAGGAANLVSFHFAAGSLRWWQSDWDDAMAEYSAGVELPQVTSAGWRMAVYGFMAVTALERDQLDVALAVVAEADAHRALTGPQAQAQRVEWAPAHVLEARGDAAGAARLLADLWMACDAQGIHGDLPVIAPDLVRLTVAHDGRDAAFSATEGLEAMARRQTSEGIRSAALLARGVLDDDLVVLREAVEAGRRSGAPWVPGPRKRPAWQPWPTVPPTPLSCSTRPASATTASGPRARPTRRPTSGWDSLTPTEQRVAELVAVGGSNPEIGERMGLSRRTVQTHVSHILAKLTLTSRVELATAYALR